MDVREIEELRVARVRRRITLHELYALTGLRPDQVSRFENYRSEPKPDELRAWKAALGFDEPVGQ